MNGAGEIVNQVGVGIWVQQFGLSSNSDFLGAGADGVALLVAVGALMHVFAVRIGAGTVIFIVQNAVIGSWPCAWAWLLPLVWWWKGPVGPGLKASGLVWRKWRRGCILEKAWAIKGVVPPIHLADGAPGGCLAMSCKCVGIYLGLDLRPIPGIVRSCPLTVFSIILKPGGILELSTVPNNKELV